MSQLLTEQPQVWHMDGNGVQAGGILLLDDEIRLHALQALAQRGEAEAARIFATCTLTLSVDDVIADGLLESQYTLVDVVLGCPPEHPEHVQMLRDLEHPVTAVIRSALASALPPHTLSHRFATVSSAGTMPVNSAQDGNVTTTTLDMPLNQGRPIAQSPVFVWEHLHFRSKTEIRIAQALERAGVLYFPNCRARLGLPDARRTLEPDFLVCHEGAWGILEVDGEPFHQDPAADAERDALLRAAGVLLVARHSATECYERPDEVVRSFLIRLEADLPKTV